jgi:hypothetical protein
MSPARSRLSYSTVRKNAGDPVAQLSKVRVFWNEKQRAAKTKHPSGVPCL